MFGTRTLKEIRDELRAAFVEQARSHGWKVSKCSPRASRCASVQIERKRTHFFHVHNVA